jgi:hypothetical protein
MRGNSSDWNLRQGQTNLFSAYPLSLRLQRQNISKRMPEDSGQGREETCWQVLRTAAGVDQTVYGQGRVLAFNRNGIPISQVLLPGREQGHNLRSTSVAIGPGTDDWSSQLVTPRGVDPNPPDCEAQ